MDTTCLRQKSRQTIFKSPILEAKRSYDPPKAHSTLQRVTQYGAHLFELHTIAFYGFYIAIVDRAVRIAIAYSH